MTRLALLSSVALAICVTVPSLADAGGYVAAGLGTAAGTSGSSDSIGNDSRLSGRLMLGQRISLISFEAGLASYGMAGLTPDTQYDAVALSAGLKLNLPLFLGLEIFGRGGVERTWLDPDTDRMAGYRGNGYVAGAGLEYRLDFVISKGSLWADWTRHAANLRGDDDQRRSASADLWTAGVALDL